MITDFFEKYKIEKFSEPEVELLLATDYLDFLKELEFVYKQNFLLLNAFLGITENYSKPSCSYKCTKAVLKHLFDLKRLTEFV